MKGLEMEKYQERVVQEKMELDEKIAKLNSFIDSDLFLGLSQGERDRLRRQSLYMHDYSVVLGERIAAF